MYSLLALVLYGLFVASSSASFAIKSRIPVSGPLDQQQARPDHGQLNTFQVYRPVSTPQRSDNQHGCIYVAVLMEHDFANSYGAPFVGNYTPPPCSFNRVIMNLTVTSSGRQFDRLAIMYLGDVEVFRTSTAEPTQTGIIWNYVKEMHMYNALWRMPQTIIYDEPNIVDGPYTGLFNSTLTATFFTVPESPPTADSILPISTGEGAKGKGSAFRLPDQNATVLHTLPRNAYRAIISLSATGQIDEEFWYANAPTRAVDTFENTTGSLVGGGTFREVQLFIDGHLSGVSWPFPVIFTGGIVPGLWRPIVGIDAFDLRQHEIDITPWLGYLLDGQPHEFSIRVASVNEDGEGRAYLDTTPSFWLVTGTIFLFHDPTGYITTGTYPEIRTPKISLSTSLSFTQDSAGQNESLTYSTEASRLIEIISSLNTADGTLSVSWLQRLSYCNANSLTSYGLVQLTQQNVTGFDVSQGSSSGVEHSYNYPLTLNSSVTVGSNGSTLFLQATVENGKSLMTVGNTVFSLTPYDFESVPSSGLVSLPESQERSNQQLLSSIDSSSMQFVEKGPGIGLSTTQLGSAIYFASPNSSYSFGTTEQYFTATEFNPSQDRHDSVKLYRRHVKAVNTSIVRDDQASF